MRRSYLYERAVTANVLKWYLEHEDGCVRCGAEHAVFDHRILNYRIDVEAALKTLHPAELTALLAVHRDGLSHREALDKAGFIYGSRPDSIIAAIEARAGRLFLTRGLANINVYLV